MTTLNNPIKDFYKQAELEGRVITISQEKIDKSVNRINEKMEKFNQEWRYKNAQSNHEANRHYLNF